jgi:hypothetical protein
MTGYQSKKAMAQAIDKVNWADHEPDGLAHPAQEPVAFDYFKDWMVKEMPPMTTIGNPEWWAKRIYERFIYITPPQRKPLTGWQPIETAPKGQTILLYSPPLKEFSMSYTNITIAWFVSGGITGHWGTAVFFDGRSIVQHVHNPTHWMPLPDAPAAHGIKENT